MSAGSPGSTCCGAAANEVEAFLYAFDLLDLDGLDMRRELSRPARRRCQHPTKEQPARRAAE